MGASTGIQSMGINRITIGLSVLSGFLLTAAFPGIGWSLAAWVALVFLLAAIRKTSVREGFILGIVTGMAHFATLLYWLVGTMHIYGFLPIWLSGLIFILLVFYLSLYVGAFAALVGYFGSGSLLSLVTIPAFWVCLEYARGLALTGFPWGLVGYSQYEHLNLIQMADTFGVYGVSFVIVLANAVIFFAFLWVKKEKWRGRSVSARNASVSVIGLIVILALAWTYGSARIQSTDALIAAAEKQKISVIQGNISQSVKWDAKFLTDTIVTYVRLSEAAGKDDPDLIVWPETAIPFYFKYNVEWTKMVLAAMGGMNTWFLAGSPSVDFERYADKYYNSAYLVTPDGDIKGRYDKAHLVPFGEYVPMKRWLPFIDHMVAQVGEFKAGRAGGTLAWPPADIGVLICYEIIFPELASELAANHSKILVNITNDAWFGKTSAPYQHFSMAVFRAVENRRALVRAANTGVSGFIDPTGRILEQSSLFTEAAMTREVPVMENPVTFYTRHGDLAVLCCFIWLGIIIILQFSKNKEALCPSN
ncbi:MAG: apolipoprotein N-acyltransferase [Desulfobacterales bacterium CG23_combo_of_CG06-09_8_20_14_all_51_8]|nr:MAG: apolipoprotein N-acyltransferase [Desulfobacterales bacterium CG23_combo_of_CG06-09_8_20_14_all_51_8]